VEYRLGLIVNPIAGMGGSVGLKGTDGELAAVARKLGATPVASERAGKALSQLAGFGDSLSVLTCAGEMGADAAAFAGLEPRVLTTAADRDTIAADTRAVSAAAQAEGFELVVAMGGDGMVHHVANGIGGTGTPLGIVPVGTTNVLARLLGIPSRATKAADLICSRPPPRPAPAAMLAMDHGGGGVETRLATFACGAGFDAEHSNVKICRNARHFTFDGFAEDDEDIAASWRKLLEREGKSSPDGTSVRDLVPGPTSGD